MYHSEVYNSSDAITTWFLVWHIRTVKLFPFEFILGNEFFSSLAPNLFLQYYPMHPDATVPKYSESPDILYMYSFRCICFSRDNFCMHAEIQIILISEKWSKYPYLQSNIKNVQLNKIRVLILLSLTETIQLSTFI